MPDAEAVIERATRLQHNYLLVEGAGLFWIGAELAILYFVLAAVRHLRERPMESFQFGPQEVRRAWWWGIGFLLVVFAVYGRHLLWMSLPEFLERNPAATPAALSAIYRSRAHTHQLVWCTFISLWVVLEALIVSNGWRGFRQLQHLLGRTQP